MLFARSCVLAARTIPPKPASETGQSARSKMVFGVVPMRFYRMENVRIQEASWKLPMGIAS